MATQVDPVVIVFLRKYTTHSTNVGSMLVRRLQRPPNIDPTLVKCLVFAGLALYAYKHVLNQIKTTGIANRYSANQIIQYGKYLFFINIIIFS